jgi:uroporphyrinogen decarboxylase
VRAALNHEETDRVPVDFGASRVTGIAAIAYKRLLKDLGVDETVKIYDIKQQLAEPSMEMINRMGGDVVQLHRLGPSTGMPFLAIDQWKPGQMTDGTTCLVPEAYSPTFKDNGSIEIWHEGALYARRPADSLYFDVCPVPLANAETTADIDRFVWPDEWSEREDQFIRKQVNDLYHNTDKAVFAGLPLLNCSFFEYGIVMFGYERFMENLILNRDLMEYWLDAQLAHSFSILDKFLAIAGPYLDVIQTNDDYGAQDALQIRPGMYREIFKPRQKKWIEFVKARTKAKVFIHCDGAIEEILPDFIEIGIDVLNPLQTSARGMDPVKIKRKFGKDLAFWGGDVETQTTLPFGSLDDVRREVRSRVALLGQGGGHVAATIHNIQPDIPSEKIIAVFDAIREAGRYPLDRHMMVADSATSD